MTFLQSMPVKDLDRQHPEYAANEKEWQVLELLNEGGYKLKMAAAQFLGQKPKEPQVVYEARIRAFTYENILGPILDWYRARMASAHSEISILNDSEPATDEWYARFHENCERPSSKRQYSLQNFLADRFKDLILYQRAYTLIDKPQPTAAVRTKLEQREAGLLDPYLVAVSPTEVIDWSMSEEGELEYVVIKCAKESRTFGADASSRIAWYIYNREGYAHYEASIKSGKPEKIATLISSGPHALTEQKRVPVIPWVAGKGQWLADRAVLSLLAHLDLLNANKWSMWNALLPMLVISGAFEGDAIRSEIAYLNVDKDGDAKYLSPDAAVFEVADKKLQSCKEETYRQMHVQAQARTASATAMAQSGVSKQEDMTAASEVLNGFGADLRGYADAVERAVVQARGDEYDVKVTGWEFDDDQTSDVLDAAERCDRLVIGSETFDRQMRKRVVRAAAPDLPANVFDAIDKEIDAAPSPEERRAAERKEAAGALAKVAKRKVA
jgi:hypothetical protein